MKFKTKHHLLLMAVTVVISVVCGIMIPHINVNSDMTKYLPNGSQMKRGLGVMSEEFDASSLSMPEVRAMFTGLSNDESKKIQQELSENPNISNVTYRSTAAGDHTVFEITVPKSVDQKKLGKEIKAHYKQDILVETSQDGATPPLSVIIIAAVLILIILFLMSKSWIEPILFMISTGVAIVLNIGTNALLPSVSITTNYIVAILQLVLSLDYSIVMMNRYRQEKDKGKEAIDAINSAVPKARTAVISSAITTIVGLLMLCFMRLKIGMDMGVVLAKGVVFSLICTFTVLPSLILLFKNALEATLKKGFRIPTGRLARLGAKYKILWTCIFLAVFAGSLILHNKTTIRFSTNSESAISEFFPKKNNVVVVYENSDEGAILALADSIKTLDKIESIISYPTILQKQYTVDDMATAISGISSEMGEVAASAGVDLSEMPSVDLLSPETLRIAYYMKNADDKQIKIKFPDLANFIMVDCLQSELLSGIIDDDMRSKIELLSSMTDVPGASDEAEEVNAEQPVSNIVDKPAAKEEKVSKKEEEKPIVITPIVVENTGEILVSSFMPKYDSARGSDLSSELARITDTTRLQKNMGAEEMSEFIGSTMGQTRMVYSFSKKSSKKMTPIEYVHFLLEDLFQRKALSAMVNSEQKEGLRLRTRLMDYANAGVMLSAADMAALLREFGESDVTEEYVNAIAFPKVLVAEAEETSTNEEVCLPEPADSTLIAAVDTIAVAEPEPAPAPKPAPKKRKTQAEIQAEAFEYLMYSGKSISSAEMSKYLKKFGQEIDPSLIDMLYTFYASKKDYDESWTMTIEELINFVADNFIEDSRFDEFIDDDTRSKFGNVKSMLNDGVGMLKSDKHSIAIVVADLPDESPETYDFIEKITGYCDETLENEHYLIGESVMFSEMKNNFNREMALVTWLTVIAIFLIVALTFQSLIVPLILVMTVMCGVFVNVVVSGIGGGTMLYLAYLIVQSILMGATIDYGILFTNYYKEKRKKYEVEEAVQEAYKGSINTIMTSGLIMFIAPGVMSLLVQDPTISAIVGSLAIGAGVSIALILLVLPGLLAAFDRMVVFGWAGRRKIKDIRSK